MRKSFLLLAILAGIASGLWLAQNVQAARGIPGSGEFGYGARLALDGLYFEDALNLAVDLPLDWLAAEARWRDLTDPQSPAWQRLDSMMTTAARAGVPVLLSLTTPPETAQTSRGPDPAQTAQFVLSLAQRYPHALRAVELFPGANTLSGWGAHPNPAAYSQLFSTVQAQLSPLQPQLVLAAAGLQPFDTPQSGADMNDLEFLAGLYLANPALALPVISIHLEAISTDPLALPSEIGARTLRHYEQVRAVMLQNNRQNDLIWVTSFQIPSGTINAKNLTNQGGDSQKQFFIMAQNQMRSQLYIGTTFYNCLNPAANSTTQAGCLVKDPTEYHPLVPVFRELIAQNSPSIAYPRNGKPKNEAFIKNRH